MRGIETAIQLCKAGGTLPKCRADRTTKISIDMIVAVAILYFALTCYILIYKLRKYKKQPYEEIQVAVVFYRLQVTMLPTFPLLVCIKVAVKLYQCYVCRDCMECKAQMEFNACWAATMVHAKQSCLLQITQPCLWRQSIWHNARVGVYSASLKTLLM